MPLRRNDALKWGSHAPPRAVLRALAEHIRASPWGKHSVSRKISTDGRGRPSEHAGRVCSQKLTESLRLRCHDAEAAFARTSPNFTQLHQNMRKNLVCKSLPTLQA